LFHVTNQQSSRDQVVATTTTTTTKSCDQHPFIRWKLKTILFLLFPHAYKAKLTSSPDDTMMQFKTSGGGSMALKFVEINCIIVKKKVRWLELVCWLTRTDQ